MIRKLLLVLLCLLMVGCQKEEIKPKPDDPAPVDPVQEVSDTMVVYFSATGNTEKVAKLIAEITEGKLVEIIPAQPYSSEDLNYSDKETRATREQNDPSARPVISNEISLDGCKVLYLGYPIWWGRAPKIMSTFVEKYDLSGITVIPFCTSGSSDIGSSDDELAAVAGKGNWLAGKRFSGSASKSSIEDWINSLEVDKMEKNLSLYINERKVPVTWEDNASVKEIRELAASGQLKVEMSMYGGFEQVGDLGRSITRNDRQTTTASGDIVLYSGSNIVIFYGSNSWSYTRLGHVDLDNSEMTKLLSNGDVTVTLTVE